MQKTTKKQPKAKKAEKAKKPVARPVKKPATSAKPGKTKKAVAKPAKRKMTEEQHQRKILADRARRARIRAEKLAAQKKAGKTAPAKCNKAKAVKAPCANKCMNTCSKECRASSAKGGCKAHAACSEHARCDVGAALDGLVQQIGEWFLENAPAIMPVSVRKPAVAQKTISIPVGFVKFTVGVPQCSVDGRKALLDNIAREISDLVDSRRLA